MSFHGIPENDVITRDKFVIRRFIRNGMQGQSGFSLWCRPASEMYLSGNKQ